MKMNLNLCRDGSAAAATSKEECFVTIVNGFQPLTIITKRSILYGAAALDPLLINIGKPCKNLGVKEVIVSSTLSKNNIALTRLIRQMNNS